MGDERGIRVICRFRPQNKIEDGKGGTCCVQFLSPTTLKVGGHEFVFDRVFDGSCTQTDIFEQVKPAVKDVLGGYNATIFCYGQTSSGKTFTMQGPDIDNPALRGIIPRIVEDIFVEIAAAASDVEFVISASYLEIYLEKIRDLLDPKKDNLSVREDRIKGIYVQDMTEVYVQNTTEVFEVIRVGQHNRAISPTGMNAESSRSHSVFLLNVRATDRRTDSKSSGRLYLVDLAGSEKVGKTGASGTTLEEAKMINKSLSALGLVIKALTEGKGQHVPYRDSKLTRLLQESLGGNARTTLIINCSPSSYNEDETLSTLRFGARAKTIKNKVKANVERSPAELRALLNKAEAEIARLKAIIKAGGKCSPADLGESTAATAAEGSASGEELLKLTEQCREAQRRIEEAKEENTRLLDRAEALEDKIRGLSEQVTKGDAAEAALAELRERCAELTAENTGLRTELSEARRVAASTQMKLDDSGIQNEMLTKELARAREELESAVQHQHYVAAMSSLSAPTPAVAGATGGAIATTPALPDGEGEGDSSSSSTKAWQSAGDDIISILQSGYERLNAIGSELSDISKPSSSATKKEGGEKEEEDAEGKEEKKGEEESAGVEADVEVVRPTPTVPAKEKAAELNDIVDKAIELLTEEDMVATFEDPLGVSPAKGESSEEEEKGESREEEEEEEGLKVEDIPETDSVPELKGIVEALKAELEKARAKARQTERLRAEVEEVRVMTEKRLSDMEALKNMLLQDVEKKCMRSADLQQQINELNDKYEALRRAQPLGSIRHYKKQIVTQQRVLLNACRELDKARRDNKRLVAAEEASHKKLVSHLSFEAELESELRTLQVNLREAILDATEARRQLEAAKAAAAPAPAALPPSLTPTKISKPIHGGGAGQHHKQKRSSPTIDHPLSFD